ncbi:hypothetical protein TWF225_011118 [Orbilia oligospora]|nr:hypothetical protein TWF225_011118 [Orbilia oligospora]KAF3248495.1 hypothetical protein TWF217_009095 [Orbilia oligospora]KAF3251280.1 hypothetical protein TWF128_007284 [Orbilia oligospora]KAF3288051.1 hypothetical protein TWF132_008032 [Orbilia oligospora]
MGLYNYAYSVLLAQQDGGNGTGNCGDGRDFTDPRSGTTDLVTQLTISVAMGMSAFLSFCVLRPRWNTLYSARKANQAPALPDLPSSFFGWIPALYKISEEEVLSAAGLDAYVFLGFFKMSMKILSVFTFFGLFIVSPLHWKFEGKSGFDFSRPGSSNDTCTNDTVHTWDRDGFGGGDLPYRFLRDHGEPKIPKNTAWLTSYLIFVYFFTGVAVYFLYDQTKKVATVRQKYLSRQSTVTDRTIRVSGVPEHLRNEDELKRFIEGLRIGKVENVTICRDWKELDKLMDKRMKVLRKLESAYTVPKGQDPLTRTVKSGWFGLYGKKINPIEQYTGMLEDLNNLVHETRQKEFNPVPMAFVTLDSVAAAQMAVQALLDPNPLSLIANLAPAPHDIVWQNTYISRGQRIIRMWIITIFIGILTIFWLLPVGTLAGLLNIKSIHRVWPWLADVLASNQLVSSLVQNTLPTASLTLLNIAVPYLYDWLSTLQGMISQADVERSVVSKNFFFTFFNLFLIFTVFGTVSDMYNVLKDSLKDSTTIAYRLAKSLGSFAPFYTNLIVLQGIGMFPFRLLEFGTVALYVASRPRTPRDHAELNAPPAFQYGFFLPQPILVLILCVVYSLLEAGTVMLGFGLIYFSLGYFTYKYQLLYAMDNPRHATGKAWPMIVYRVFIGLLLFQASMAALLSLQGAIIRGLLILPLLVATTWTWWFFRKSFSPLMSYIALKSLNDPEYTPREGSLIDIETETVDESRELGSRFVNPNLVAELQGLWLHNGIAGGLAALPGITGVLPVTSSPGGHV